MIAVSEYEMDLVQNIIKQHAAVMCLFLVLVINGRMSKNMVLLKN